MTTTMFNIEEFNEATQALWNEARSRGFREGEEKGRHDTADWHMRGNLDLAEKMLRTAAGLPSGEGDKSTRYLSMYAKLLLHRTPLMHRGIDRVLAQLKAESWLHDSGKEPSRLAIQGAADQLKAILGETGGYF